MSTNRSPHEVNGRKYIAVQPVLLITPWSNPQELTLLTMILHYNSIYSKHDSGKKKKKKRDAITQADPQEPLYAPGSVAMSSQLVHSRIAGLLHSHHRLVVIVALPEWQLEVLAVHC